MLSSGQTGYAQMEDKEHEEALETAARHEAELEEHRDRQAADVARYRTWLEDQNATRSGFGRDAFGHTGFTGTSVWGDPATGVAVTILTSRLYYGRESTTDGILAFRRLVHESALRRYG